MTKEQMFIDAHKKAYGESVARKVFNDIKKTIPDEKAATKVFLNEFGNEVHVNGPIAESLQKEETLQERIARFDALSERVAAIRLARAMGIIESDDGPDEDVNDDSLLDDVEERDDFGEIVEKPLTKAASNADVDGEKAAAPQSQAAEKPITEALDKADVLDAE